MLAIIHMMGGASTITTAGLGTPLLKMPDLATSVTCVPLVTALVSHMIYTKRQHKFLEPLATDEAGFKHTTGFGVALYED